MKREQGYQTKNSQRIKDFVQSQKNSYFSANDVHKYFLLEGTQISMPTVYRQLEKLEALGFLKKFRSTESDRAFYIYVDTDNTTQNQPLMKCVSCGATLPLECHSLEDLVTHVEEHHHFQIDLKDTLLYGKCDTCAHTKHK